MWLLLYSKNVHSVTLHRQWYCDAYLFHVNINCGDILIPSIDTFVLEKEIDIHIFHINLFLFKTVSFPGWKIYVKKSFCKIYKKNIFSFISHKNFSLFKTVSFPSWRRVVSEKLTPCFIHIDSPPQLNLRRVCHLTIFRNVHIPEEAKRKE